MISINPRLRAIFPIPGISGTLNILLRVNPIYLFHHIHPLFSFFDFFNFKFCKSVISHLSCPFSLRRAYVRISLFWVQFYRNKTKYLIFSNFNFIRVCYVYDSLSVLLFAILFEWICHSFMVVFLFLICDFHLKNHQSISLNLLLLCILSFFLCDFCFL